MKKARIRNSRILVVRVLPDHQQLDNLILGPSGITWESIGIVGEQPILCDEWNIKRLVIRHQSNCNIPSLSSTSPSLCPSLPLSALLLRKAAYYLSSPSVSAMLPATPLLFFFASTCIHITSQLVATPSSDFLSQAVFDCILATLPLRSPRDSRSASIAAPLSSNPLSAGPDQLFSPSSKLLEYLPL